MTYLETAKAVLSHKPATKAIEATNGSLAAVWKAGGWLIISDNCIRAVRVPPELRAWVAGHEKEILRTLHRRRIASLRGQPTMLRRRHEDAPCRPGADEGA